MIIILIDLRLLLQNYYCFLMKYLQIIVSIKIVIFVNLGIHFFIIDFLHYFFGATHFPF